MQVKMLHYVNSYQYDELIRTIDIRKKYQDLFGDDEIGNEELLKEHNSDGEQH